LIAAVAGLLVGSAAVVQAQEAATCRLQPEVDSAMGSGSRLQTLA
jgi:hypothetical protein